MNNKNRSIIAMLFSAFAFSLMGVFVKAIPEIPVIQKSLFRTATVMIIFLIFMRKEKVKINSVNNHKLLIIRSVLGTMGILLNYYALDNLILSDANVIFRLSSIFVVIFSWIFLKENVSKKEILPIIGAFIGVGMIIKPEFSFEMIPYLLAILGAVFAAGAYTALRALGGKEHPTAIIFYFSTFTTIVLLPFVAMNFISMNLKQISFAVLAGVCAAGGQLGITLAYKYAPAKEVSIFNYFGVVFSAVFSIFVFGNIPDFLSVLGYIVVFGMAFYSYKLKR